MNKVFKVNYPFERNLPPSQSWRMNPACTTCNGNDNDDRYGFLLPFITGAVVSAPFWYLGANNKAQQQMQTQQMYYQNQPYPMYYPYPGGNTSQVYFPYPPYR